MLPPLLCIKIHITADAAYCSFKGIRSAAAHYYIFDNFFILDKFPSSSFVELPFLLQHDNSLGLGNISDLFNQFVSLFLNENCLGQK